MSGGANKITVYSRSGQGGKTLEEKGFDSSLTPTDLAYQILLRHGKPIHYKELIDQILAIKALRSDNPHRLAAQIHTEINLDNRFVHMGQGLWGLRKWAPRQQSRVVTLLPGSSRRVYEEEEDTRLDELELIEGEDNGGEDSGWDSEE